VAEATKTPTEQDLADAICTAMLNLEAALWAHQQPTVAAADPWECINEAYGALRNVHDQVLPNSSYAQ
jgi:hypothetical protein